MEAVSINIKDFESIIIVIEEKNITRAARRLFVSQPTLSQCIQRVESELNTTLFVRTKNGIELTDAGRTFMEASESIIKTYRNLGNTLSDMNELNFGNLVLGIPALLNEYLMPEAYMEFKQNHPGIHVEIYEDDSARLEVLLNQGKIDLAIMSLPVDNSLIQIPMLSCDMVLCAPSEYDPGEALDPQTNTLDLRKLEGQPFIFPRPSQKLNLVVESVLKKASIHVKNVLYTRSSKAAMLYSSLGLGFTLQPELSVVFYRSILKERGRIYRIPPEFNSTWSIVLARSKNGFYSRAARCFVQETKSFYENRLAIGVKNQEF